jgi:hypothetical protein
VERGDGVVLADASVGSAPLDVPRSGVQILANTRYLDLETRAAVLSACPTRSASAGREDLSWLVDVAVAEAGQRGLPVTWVAVDVGGEAASAVGVGEFDIAESGGTVRAGWWGWSSGRPAAARV